MKKFAFLAIGLAVVTASTTALAGYKWSYPVTIYDWGSSGAAEGHLGATRNSDVEGSYIGCELNANNDYSYVTCYAADGAGKYLGCYNRLNEGMKQSIGSLTDGSFLAFHTSASDPSSCAFIQVANSSMNPPPQL